MKGHKVNPNRCTLQQLADMRIAEVKALPLPHIAMLLEDVRTEETRVKGLKLLLQTALDERFSDAAARARKAKGKDTGRVTLKEEGCRIVAELPPLPNWDQDKLKSVAETIVSWGEPLEQYMALNYKVSETAYKAWPDSIRKLFEPARTLSVGKPAYAVEILSEREAA
jgi:hypothetical protein